jgi:hypothetical protein
MLLVATDTETGEKIQGRTEAAKTELAAGFVIFHCVEPLRYGTVSAECAVAAARSGPNTACMILKCWKFPEPAIQSG